MTHAEANHAIKAKAVEIWSAERFHGSRADAWRSAELALGFTADMFPFEPIASPSAEFTPFAGELFA